MIVIIDNYDSFVFNIARYFRKLGEATEVVRNDAVSVSDVVGLKPRAVVISPGPCTPMEAGISMAVVRELSGRVPILGICLGHQCIGSVFGGRVARAHRPMHGRFSYVTHDGRGLFESLPSPLRVGRYHSLVVELDDSCSPHLAVTARSDEGEIMALAHCHQPTYGVQFHPESILTERGHVLLMNFLQLAYRSVRRHEAIEVARREGSVRGNQGGSGESIRLLATKRER
ncbi:aminodeoxychorismate/anthranilate synthase component II (plasmid) [Bradyrhizobium sp. ISRA443]|uniref:anthranilate synthase component II n=1 Tax=unclassified Bradyrhizobium TaxID=2631580 RepID=UPI002478460F|nr:MULTISPECIES: aminodeoxychorismate/anthranilate synthase component II [unclassified Bradyrhizobium]WGR90686.1 aminodeoxychorismate/anthranilate synthase component II [Bradyrhizobium sp. ISRA435]WGS03202.1 aminodeoxychorismate/anthranilate synthase component II [Bradyrhizobium sp. ISRA436]WGS10004.1 aminodeoxychorismate/anthranilate synthase component II [Bradyrhizobium sp. ISRA437]WGS16889.1 aminodeoxychorismate/anthranilate synthase component II [Bradyrhizobium sp. ISRA443]